MSNGTGKYTTKTKKMKKGLVAKMAKKGYTFKGSESTGKAEWGGDHYKGKRIGRTGTFTRENTPVYESRPSYGTPPPPKKYKKPRRR
tara:strand:+ start:340 stop:600 length:261 start_codon:yes stop_codon:yes gene_type:complete